MELWIRSQDKKALIRVEDLIIVNMGGFKRAIGTFTKKFESDKCCLYLGTYENEKRALEVLDEIQKRIAPRGIIKQDKKGIELTMIDVPQVYEMPKE